MSDRVETQGEPTVESVKAEIRELSGHEPTWDGYEWLFERAGDYSAFCIDQPQVGRRVGDLLCWLDVNATQETANAR